MAELRKKKILCIEDDPEAAALIAEELVERGWQNDRAGFDPSMVRGADWSRMKRTSRSRASSRMSCFVAPAVSATNVRPLAPEEVSARD